MGEYKHYIRTNEAGIVIHGFSSAFEQPIEGDVEIFGEHGRHFQLQLKNIRGQFVYRLDGTDLVERSHEELDDEWAARPPAPPNAEERIGELETVSIDTMLALTEVYETNSVQDATREQEGIDTMLALTEAYELILLQQATIEELLARVTALEGGEN